MHTETISQEPGLLIRRAVLAPGEATPWHRDLRRRFTVVVRGVGLTIEYQDREIIEVAVHPGLADWDAPEDRVHRAVNTGRETFEEVVTFFLEPGDLDPQPEASQP